MTNMLLLIGFTLFYLSIALLMCKLGRVWLQCFLGTAYLTTLAVTGMFFDVVGLTVTLGMVTYAGIFLASDMLTERYGPAVGYQTVRIGGAVTLVYVVATQGVLLVEPLPFSVPTYQAMEQVFDAGLRAMLAGVSVYLFAQHFDVWLYHKLHSHTGQRLLWLRNIASTATSQVLDTVLFFTLAFYGTMPNAALLELILVGVFIKWLVALADTPFIYLARRITPWDTY